MTGRAVLITAFSIALGHLAYGVYGPPRVTDYRVQGQPTALGAQNSKSRQIYLRRTFHLSEQPRRGWLRVVGRDQLKVFVNGKLVGGGRERSLDVAVVADITRQLQKGANVIAISASQKSVSQPPLVSVEAGYVIGQSVRRINTDRSWRVSERIERQAGWWFETDFDDRNWEPARRTQQTLRGRVDGPPGSITSSGLGKWISSTDLEYPVSNVRREFEIAGRPREGWLRLTTNAFYRLAINGVVIDQQENGVGLDRATTPVQRVYDVSPVLVQGKNVISLLLTKAGGHPQLLADLEVRDRSGRTVAVGSDADWKSRPGITADWLLPQVNTPTDWQDCAVVGELAVVPWKIPRKVVELNLPMNVRLVRWAAELGLMVLIAAVSLLACIVVGRFMPSSLASESRTVSRAVVPLCLFPSTLAVAIGVLLTCDPRIDAATVYQEVWLTAAVSLVIVQWCLLVLAAKWNKWPSVRLEAVSKRLLNEGWLGSTNGSPQHSRRLGAPLRCDPSHPRVLKLFLDFLGFVAGRRQWSTTLILVGLIVVGFWMRVSGIENDPLHPDETTMYRAVQGIFECGFPSVVIHENLPRAYVATSEAVYFPQALASLFFDDPRYVIRIPSVCFGTFTIALIFFVGRHLFGVSGGLIAAGIYTFAPVCISMTNFGRYLSQLQFLTLLTTFLFYRTVAGSGPLNRRMLWLTTASFILTFLSWEGVALIALGMVAACLCFRRQQLETVLINRQVWLALFVVALVVLFQHSHRQLHQTSMLWFGTGASNISLTPMWLYPQFDLFYYVWAGSWQRNAFLPIVGLLGAGLLAISHPHHKAVRYLSFVLYANCALFALFLPVKAGRYAYHLVPFVILLNSATISALAGYFYKLATEPGMLRQWKPFVRGLGTVTAVACVLVASGLTVRSENLTMFHVAGPAPGELRVADQQATTHFVLEHLRKGDVVLAISPHVVEYEWKLATANALADRGAVNYWIESKLQLQPTLDDVRPTTLHRLSGTTMVSTVAELEYIFAQHRRIWYLTSPNFHGKLNTDAVSSYLRQHMDIVYEDFQSMVLFRDANHRPASIRQRDERALKRAKTLFLP